MKVLLLNGSPNEKGCTFTALQEVENALNRQGIETEMLWLGKKAFSGCIACNKCQETGYCCMDDKVNELLKKLPSIDGIVIGSPVYYGSASGQLTAFLDRAFQAGFWKSRWANIFGAAVVSCRRGGASSAFDQLNKYFMMNNMPVVSSQYWNQVHGMTPENVKQDVEGLQTMRILANNMAWLLKSVEAGRNADVPMPQTEERVFTNFIH